MTQLSVSRGTLAAVDRVEDSASVPYVRTVERYPLHSST